MGSETVRWQVIFHGRVQGVGFRATTRYLARSRPVTGFVQNLANGTVELIVEGTESALDDFLQAIDRKFSGNIQEVEVTTGVATGEFADFSIRR